MLKVDYHLNIEVTQGDSGCLFFGSNPYSFMGSEELRLELFLGDEIIFSKKSNIVDRGLLFLELTEQETLNLPKGIYGYRVFMTYDDNSMSEYVVNSKQFTVKGV